MKSTAKTESIQKRCSLRLPSDTHIWFTNQVHRIAHKEGLTQFSITALMRRIAAANLDLSLSALKGLATGRGRRRKKAAA